MRKQVRGDKKKAPWCAMEETQKYLSPRIMATCFPQVFDEDHWGKIEVGSPINFDVTDELKDWPLLALRGLEDYSDEGEKLWEAYDPHSEKMWSEYFVVILEEAIEKYIEQRLQDPSFSSELQKVLYSLARQWEGTIDELIETARELVRPLVPATLA